MVKVFLRNKMNARLGGEMFYMGVAEFENIEEGIKFAEMYYLKYEVVEVEKPKRKRAVK